MAPHDMTALRSSCLAGLDDLSALEDTRSEQDGGASAYELECRIGRRAELVLLDLRALLGEVRRVARVAERRRWRRWLLGGTL
ncbi:23S rRNA (-N6)-methyltransferase [Ophiocordyceps camponoti-floridani]|uniref:23S rRNA (-N6)-methyltransferase n=1 Tax=Ophiocordyceps camponoti-floridani TaxID=2030778 RepID=A0A8H4VBX3_9HYPO|nr:23S rRNA (-N6)-methyltransferase [Ophiocordyceps camponoti-floridani]